MRDPQVRAIVQEKIRERPGAAPAGWGTVIFGLIVMWLLVLGTGAAWVYAEFVR